MDLLKLQQKLIGAARKKPPGDGVPYAFQKRIMARLAGLGAVNPWLFWERGLSRSAGLCVVLVLLLSGISLLPPATSSESLSQDVEQTLFAAVDSSSLDATIETR